MSKQFSIGKENTIRGKLLYAILRLLMPLVRLIWIKEIKGKENLPKKGPYIIAANHQSYMDIICLMSALPDVRLTFLAAERMFSAPCLKQLMIYTGQIKVDRKAPDKNEVIAAGLEALKNNKILAIFPQGTRSRNGKIEKAFTGVARFALESGVPVIPVGIKNTYEILPHYKILPAMKKIVKIEIGQAINLSRFSNNLDLKNNYRLATNVIMKGIARLAEMEYKTSPNA
ncbi:MAG: lysophospholipid acyltransferase family protein [Patescibacteria group bacterium]|jgi:1-acyl-sn-glycerol-3-phosphate acyltransferase